MSVFTEKKLKETRMNAHLSQEEVAKALKISERKVRTIEANESPVTSDEIIEFAKLYHVDVRELLLESYNNEEEERILSNRYGSLTKLHDQLSDRDKEDVIWVIKQRIEGRI